MNKPAKPRAKRTKKPRVKKPKAITSTSGIPVVECERAQCGKRYLVVSLSFANATTARRLAAWLPKAIAWMEDAP